MNTEKKNDIPQAIVDFLGRLLQWLEQTLDTLIKGPQRGKPDQDKTGTENAPADGQNTWRILWLMLLVLLLLTWFNTASELRREEIPYNQFLDLVKQNRIDRAIVTEKLIPGLLPPCHCGMPIWRKNWPSTTCNTWSEAARAG